MTKFTSKRQAVIYKAILSSFDSKGVASYDKLTRTVSRDLKGAAQKPVTNWLEVRGVLQYLLDNKTVSRSHPIDDEIYVLNSVAVEVQPYLISR